ncbi:MAG: FkbM family methyltransferase [Gammaproteobacteria bacterium]|nr:FkbM family methyltransferase [Gammaproteobacteria bacterium]
MKKLMKNLVKLALGERLFRMVNKFRIDFLSRKSYPSYAQEGEDRVLSVLLFRLHGGKHISDGFYVDVGAHHPYRFSNTCLFYKQGWHGINIDAMPGSMTAFNKQRPKDINLECGIGQKVETLKFFVFNEPALNTFNESLAKSRCNDVWQIKETVDVDVLPLSEILKKYVPKGQRIDFLSVDVEGFDLDVLQSNNWQEYRPLVVLVETLGLSFEDLASDPVTEYLRSLGYIVYSKTVNTTFFVDKIFMQQAG